MSTEQITLAVTGMTCAHCVTAVTTELLALVGVSGAEVDLVAGGDSRVLVTATAPVDLDDVIEAISEAGYSGRVAPGAERV